MWEKWIEYFVKDDQCFKTVYLFGNIYKFTTITILTILLNIKQENTMDGSSPH